MDRCEENDAVVPERPACLCWTLVFVSQHPLARSQPLVDPLRVAWDQRVRLGGKCAGHRLNGSLVCSLGLVEHWLDRVAPPRLKAPPILVGQPPQR